MTNQDASRLDTAIDSVVGDMMRVEPRRDLTGRVLQSLGETPQPRWFWGRPLLVTAALASLLLVTASALLFRPQPIPPIPSVTIVSGPPAALAASIPAPTAPALATPGLGSTARQRPTRSAAPTPEAIFGPRTERAAAASIRSVPRVRVVLLLRSPGAESAGRRDGVTLVLSRGEWRSARAKSESYPPLELEAKADVLASGSVELVLHLAHPVRQELTVTLTPGKTATILDASDAQGRPYTVEATAIVLRPNKPQR
jgi:hypothetical protein